MVKRNGWNVPTSPRSKISSTRNFALVTDPAPGTSLEDYIHGYAKIAEFLSNTTAFREAATSLSTDLALLGTPLFTANVRGAFLYVVGAMAEAYGFSSDNTP